MLGGADNPNGELPSYITGADRRTNRTSLKRSESHFKRFFSFRMVFLMVVSNEAAERDSGLLSGRSKKDQITDHMI